jgi:hypothetical protein
MLVGWFGQTWGAKVAHISNHSDFLGLDTMGLAIFCKKMKWVRFGVAKYDLKHTKNTIIFIVFILSTFKAGFPP